jgi:hypothetical protein
MQKGISSKDFFIYLKTPQLKMYLNNSVRLSRGFPETGLALPA